MFKPKDCCGYGRLVEKIPSVVRGTAASWDVFLDVLSRKLAIKNCDDLLRFSFNASLIATSADSSPSFHISLISSTTTKKNIFSSNGFSSFPASGSSRRDSLFFDCRGALLINHSKHAPFTPCFSHVYTRLKPSDWQPLGRSISAPTRARPLRFLIYLICVDTLSYFFFFILLFFSE